MSIDVPSRMPDPELQERYRAEGLWHDRSFGEFFDGELTACAAFPVHIWSQSHPYRGSVAEFHGASRRFASGPRVRR